MVANSSAGWWQKRLDQAYSFFDSEAKFKDWKYNGCHSECIRLVENHDALRSYFDVTKVYQNKSLKSLEKASSCRLEGNYHFCKKNFADALRCYNQGITYAPHYMSDDGDKDEYTLCIANRSAVLFHLSNYQSSLMDIDEALRRNYQPRYKLLVRKANCLYHLKQHIQARKCCENALESLETSLGEVELNHARCEIQKMLEKLEKVSIGRIHFEEKVTPDLPKVKGSQGTILMKASNHIKLEFHSNKGRYLVSEEQLEIGDVLIVESPYVTVLLPPYYSQRCYHCLKSLTNFYPCPSCLIIKFCSPDCCREAMTTYHDVECPIMDVLNEVGVAHLALRIIVKTKLKNLLEFRDRLSKEKLFIPSETSPLKCNYEGVYHLVHNTHNIGHQDLFQYTMTSILLLKCLDQGSFFGSCEESSIADIRDFVGGSLLRHICQLICNAHAITDLQLRKLSDKVESEHQVRIAAAIYPTASMINHSCAPNISSSFHGDVLVVKAISQICVGQEIVNCYGPHFKHMGKRMRQEMLHEQYGFTCSCMACLSERDLDFNELTMAFKCFFCQGKVIMNSLGEDCKTLPRCNECGETCSENCVNEMKSSFKKSSHLFQEGVSLLGQEDVKNAAKMFERSYRLRKKVCHNVNLKLAEVIDALAQCFALEGNFISAEKHLRHSILIIKEIYGTESLEYAHDLRKYIDVCIQAGKSFEAQEKVKEALDIFTRYYGEEHNTVLELHNILRSSQHLDFLKSLDF